jgi:pyruvate,water dikinase
MVVWLGQSATVATVGAKSAHLSRLSQRYPVPQGFCLSVAAFTQWVAAGCPDHLPEPLQRLVEEAYQQLAALTHVDNPPVAVRSSAVDEDSRNASFAGQYESYLNVSGVDAVSKAILACWHSAFAERVLIYRRNALTSVACQPLAVLVQRMVPADIAMVVFSRHPITHEPDVVINATWGLGPSLVDGSTTPDTYVVRRSDGVLLERTVGTKTTMTILLPTGVKQAPTPRPMRTQAVMGAALIQEVTRLTVQLEAEMGWPVDMEAAYRHQQLHLLQCRPITT